MKKILAISILIVILSVSIISVSAQSQYEIPSWIKNTAGFWVDGKIGDQEFIQALQYLVEKDILKIPSKENTSVTPNKEDIVQSSDISGVTCHSRNGIVEINGKFTNNDDRSYSGIWLLGVLLDENGNVLATSIDNERTGFIESHQTKVFNIPIFYDGDYASCHIQINDKR